MVWGDGEAVISLKGGELPKRIVIRGVFPPLSLEKTMMAFSYICFAFNSYTGSASVSFFLSPPPPQI
jgi:hypothetical protein